MRYRKWVLAGLAILAAVVLVGFRRTLVPFALAQGIGLATQTKISYDAAAYSAHQMNLTNVHVHSRGGEAIAEIAHVNVRYDLRDLLPGSARRFGLQAIDVDRPVVTIVRHRDGSYNVPIPSSGPPPKNAPQAAPFDFTARLRNGSVSILDEGRRDPRRRYLYLEAMNGDARFDTARRSWYSVHLVYREGNRRYPVTGVASMDAVDGAMMHHWSAAKIPLPQILEYAINSPAISVQSGTLERLEARYFGIADANGNTQGHLSASAFLNGMRIAVSGIARPIRDLHGDLTVTQHGLLARRLDATVAGVPVTIGGGIVDLARPQLRVTARGSGDASSLATLAGKPLPQAVKGPIAFQLRVEGPPQQPVSLVAFDAKRVRYGAMPFENTRGVAAIGKDAQLFRFSTTYSGIGVDGRGRIAFAGDRNAIEVLAHANALSSNIPYAGTLMTRIPLRATVLATADDPKLVHTQGLVAGSSPNQHVAAAFRMSSRGIGDVYPIEVTRADRSLFGWLDVDRPHGTLEGILDARDFSLLPATTVAMPGLHVPSLPVVSGDVNGRMYGTQRSDGIALLGDVRLRGVRVNRFAISQARVAFNGSRGGAPVATVRAQGPWGTLNAAGAIAGSNDFALRGTYDGTLAALSSLGVGSPGAAGSVRAPIAMLYDGQTVVAQVDRARFSDAALQNVPLRDASATVGVRPGSVRVYAAVADVARRAHILAAGSVGKRTNLAVSVADFDLASLGAMHGPLRSGFASAAADVDGTMNAPRVRGTAMLRDSALRNMPVNAVTAFAYSANTLALNGASAIVGPAFGTLDGSIAGLSAGALQPRLDLRANVRGADANALALALNPSAARQIEGTVSARVAVRGSASAPSFDGTLSAPEGALHGLAFRDLDAAFSGTPSAVAIRNGRVTVGSTAVAFTGSAGAGSFAASIDAPRADLADFNDFFDAADTLGGRGSMQLAFSNSAGVIATNGAVALDDARYKRIELGHTVARWHQAGNRIAGDADVRGNGGSLAVNGFVRLPAGRDVATAFRTANLQGNARVRNLDLRTWLPVAGVQAPVTGFVNGEANVAGSFPDVTLRTQGSLARGTIGRVAVRRLTAAAVIDRGRGVIRDATLELPHLSARASGTFGLHRRDALAVDVHMLSPDVAALAGDVTGRAPDAAGALDTTARLRGTAANPHVHDSFALTALRYGSFNVPRVSGVVDADTKTVALSNGEIAFDRGSIGLRGHSALRPNAPVSLTMTARDVEASNFAALFAAGTKIGGRLDGTVDVRGTERAPQFDGALAFADGSFIGPDERAPITSAKARLLFAGRDVALRDAGANVGGGSVVARGAASLPNMRDIGSGSFRVAVTAHRARLDMPKYMRGEVNGTAYAARLPKRPILIGGRVGIPTARLPLSLFYNPNAPQGPAVTPPDVAFRLHLDVGNDVRVQSPNVDVGAQGALAVSGTLAKPQLAGELSSTGGTVDFFRSFRVQRGTLAFDPSNGLMPTVDAVATTTIENPQTDIALRVTGLAPSSLNIAFDSDPSYSRTQILGLLVNAQSIGAVSGVQATQQTGNGFSAGGELQNLAVGQIDTLFTRSVLEPFSAQFGHALGLENFQLAGDFRGGFGLNAAKVFGKNLSAVFSENLGTPRRQSLDIKAQGKNSSAIDLMLYASESANNAGFFSSNAFANMNALSNTTMPAMNGTNGFSLMYGHQFQ